MKGVPDRGLLAIGAVSILMAGFLVLGACNRGVKAGPDRETTRVADKLHAKGLALLDERKYNEAIDVWQREVNLEPARPKSYNDIGIAYRRLGKQALAMWYHEKAISVDPSFGHAYYSLGLIYSERKDFKTAAVLFQRAIQNGYDDADVYYNLGQACKNLQEYREALAAYGETAKRNSSFPGVHYQIGLIGALQGNAALAREELEQEMSLNGSYRIPAMARIIEMDVQKSPENAGLFFKLGKLYAEMIDKQAAANAFRRVLFLNPSYPEAHVSLGKLYLKQGDLRRAEEEYRKELAINPGSASALEALKDLRERQQG
jgi:tetratricopeptide (TPR) repeat protein